MSAKAGSAKPRGSRSVSTPNTDTQSPAVGVADVVDPALDAGLQLSGADLAGMIGGEPHPQPAVGGADLARLDQPVRRMNDEAEPGDAGIHRQDLSPLVVGDEAQGRQPLDDRRLPRLEPGLVVAEQREVVDRR